MAETVLGASADVHIYAGAATTNYASDTENIISGDRQFFNIYRTLIIFDLSGIPAGSTINSATLELYQHAESHSGSGSTTHAVYRLKRNWVEDEATWNVYSTGNSWSSAGGFHTDDCEQTAIGTCSLSGTEGAGYKSWTLDTDAISEIVESTWTNYGFMVKSQTENDDGHHFRPSEYVESAQHPKLTIDYTEGASGVTVNLSTGTIAATGRQLDVRPGAISTTLATGTITATGIQATVTPGAVSITLATGSLTATGVQATVTPGAVTITLATGTITATGIKASVGSTPPITVNLSTGSITATGQQLDVQPGAVTVTLATGTITASGVQATIMPGAITVTLATGTIAAAGVQGNVAPGAVTVTLATGSIAASGVQGSVVPGAATVNLSTGALAATGRALTVTPGAVTVALATGALTATGVQASILTAFAQTITLADRKSVV